MRASSDYHAIPDSPHELGHDNTSTAPLHTVHATGTGRWNHIQNLDSFFARIYEYHQRHGFLCCFLEDVFQLVQLIFICFFGTFLIECVDYDVMFANVVYNHTHKVTLSEAVEPLHICLSHLRGWVIWLLLIGLAVLLVQFIRTFRNAILYWEMRTFYISALDISSSDLESTTWHEVQQRLMNVQKEQLLCINRTELSQLDIYQRILRFKNYMVAMVNKNLLPLKMNVPCIGNYVFLTNGLKFNLELVLFRGPWSPFENNWHLRPDFKNEAKRLQLAEIFSRQLFWLGVGNLLLSPFIFFWQIFYAFCRWAELFRRDPGAVGARRWSLYSRLYLRHMNELDHELNARLNRAHRPAKQYLALFSSPLLTVIAKNVAFFAGAVFTSIIILSIIDEDVLHVEHIITILSVLGITVSLCRALIPDEHQVFCPETLLRQTLAHVHYMPDHWAGHAHTARVQSEFSQLFQLTPLYIMEEVFSPIITPFILIFPMRAKALEIVDFLRCFTVEVDGVGDVCSLALMDVKKHGNPQWGTASSMYDSDVHPFDQGENGKTELSLMHFKVTNPEWKAPASCEEFLRDVKVQARNDLVEAQSGVAGDNALISSILSSSDNESHLASMLPSLAPIPEWGPTQPGSAVLHATHAHNSGLKGPGVSRAEGPLSPSGGGGVLAAVREQEVSMSRAQQLNSITLSSIAPSTMCNLRRSMNLEISTGLDMSVSALYLHELHQRRLGRRDPTSPSWQPTSLNPASNDVLSPSDCSSGQPLSMLYRSSEELELEHKSQLSHASSSTAQPTQTQHVQAPHHSHPAQQYSSHSGHPHSPQQYTSQPGHPHSSQQPPHPTQSSLPASEQTAIDLSTQQLGSNPLGPGGALYTSDPLGPGGALHTSDPLGPGGVLYTSDPRSPGGSLYVSLPTQAASDTRPLSDDEADFSLLPTDFNTNESKPL